MIPFSARRPLAATAVLFLWPYALYAEPAFDFYGQVSFGLFNVDDGTDTETFFALNDNTTSRVGFWLNSALESGSSLKFNFETALGIDGSSSATVDDNGIDFHWDETDLRKFEFIYETLSYGTISAGQGSMPSDGATEADFSGTSIIAYTGISDLAGGFEFRDDDGDFSGVTIGGAFSSFDGGRLFRLRYDTPEWNNIVVSVGAGIDILTDGDDDDYYDIAARYNAEHGTIKVDGRIGYAWVDGGEELLVGSIGGLHVSSGLSLSLAGGEQKDGDSGFIYAKLGYQRDWFSFGRTFLSVDYNDGDDYVIDGSDSTSWAVAAVQKVDAYNLEIYAVYRNHDFDASGLDVEDIDAFALGARWKF